MKKDINSTKELIFEYALETGESILWEERPGAGRNEKYIKRLFNIIFIIGLISLLLGIILMVILNLGNKYGEILLEQSPGFPWLIVAVIGGFTMLLSVMGQKFIFNMSNIHYFLTNKKIIRVDYASQLDEYEIDDKLLMLNYSNVDKITVEPPLQQDAKKRTFRFHSFAITARVFREKEIKPRRYNQTLIEFEKIVNWYDLLLVLSKYVNDKLET